MAIDNIYQLTIIQRLQTQVVENVLHYKVTVDADGDTLEGALHAYAATYFMPLAGASQSSDLTYQKSRAQKIWPLPARVASEEVMYGNGLIELQSLPAEVAAVVTKQSILAGRRYRGRIYIAGIPSTLVLQVSGLWNDSLVATLQTLGVSLARDVTAVGVPGTLRPIIYHRADHTNTEIANCLARDVPRVQRRRQIGRGI